MKNNKGYMLVEIILASALAFMIAYFILILTIKLKNKNDDMMVKTEVAVDQTVITNKIMQYAQELQSSFNCDNIIIENNVIKYKKEDGSFTLINKVYDYATIGNMECEVSDNYVKVFIPITVSGLSKENFNVDTFYKITNNGCISYKDLTTLDGSSYPLFNYTGNYEIIDDCNLLDGVCSNQDAEKGDWKIRFTSSGTFVAHDDMNVDIFLVGGGSGGNSNTQDIDSLSGTATHWFNIAGGGGSGGHTNTFVNVSLIDSNSYVVVIGAGGRGGARFHNGEYWDTSYATSGKASSFDSYKAIGGSLSEGGSGGGARTAYPSNSNLGGVGGRYGKNGGNSSRGDTGGTGQNYSTCEFALPSDAAGTCPSGIEYSRGGGGYTKGIPNVINSGNGGNGTNSSDGGKGQSGIVVIRNARGTNRCQ